MDKPGTKRARKAAAFKERVDALVLYARDGGVCGICGLAVEMKDKSVDHIIPLALGGEHSYANCQIAHFRCNAAKGARLWKRVA
jgi:5-methylcytosine-specific restriction endonuclease McrA